MRHDLIMKDVVNAVEFIKFVTLAALIVINDPVAGRINGLTVCTQLKNVRPPFFPRRAEQQVRLAIIVPERTRIIITMPVRNTRHRLPGTGGIRGRGHENPLVHRGKIDLKPPRVITDRPRIDAAIVTVHPVPVQLRSQLRQIGYTMAQILPVYQIPGMQHRHARRILKGGGDKIIIAPHADDIRIGKVPGQHRVFKRAVALIAPGTVIAHVGDRPKTHGKKGGQQQQPPGQRTHWLR